MNQKERKSVEELTVLCMQEIRKHPSLSTIQGVSIEWCQQAASHHPNWRPGFVMSDNRSDSGNAAIIIRKLQNEFDCEWPADWTAR
jgi:hypothetical protein